VEEVFPFNDSHYSVVHKDSIPITAQQKNLLGLLLQHSWDLLSLLLQLSWLRLSNFDLRKITQQVEVYCCQPAEADDSSNSDSSEDPLAMMAMAFLADITNCRSYGEACTSGQWEHWMAAINDKLSKMDKYQVFEITPCLPPMHVLKTRWVYTRKIDGITGKVAAYKARWVAKGYA